ISSATEVSTSPSGPVRDVNWYRQLWWNIGSFHPKARWNEATDSVHVLKDSILHEASSDISSNIHTYASEPKSSENKEIGEFLDLKNIKRVSGAIKQRNREKKLQCESAEDQF
ncbi:17721_t:CDS:2, partial [Acaulospora morrowiae]